MSLRKLFGGWATLMMPPVGGETCLKSAHSSTNVNGAKNEHEDGPAPKSILSPLQLGNHGMRSPLGMFSFNFGQKFDANHPPTPLSRGENRQKNGFS